ncbi:MAG: TIGR02594 family protein [Pseudomonadota bacterium]
MTDTHVNEKIDSKKELKGNSHRGGDAPPEVQQKIIDIIIDEARKLQFSNRDVGYYIAIAKRESGFNPDAANSESSASGVSQLIDKTAKTYGVDNSNRFDARANIKAGLQYFMKLKRKIESNFGSSTGKFEALVYYCYHYGEFSVNRRETNKGEVVVKEVLPIHQLEGNKKYEDSNTVVDEAARIEKILDDTHGLKIKLVDVLGKNMAGRKVIVVQKKAKLAALDGVNPTPEKIPEPAPLLIPTPSANPPNYQNENNGGKPAAATERSSSIQPIGTSEIDQVRVTWELVAYEVTTDGEGNLPEITSDSQEPFVLLIPRFEYDSYNLAVANNEIQEDGNQHELFCRNEIASTLPAIKEPINEIEKKVDAKPVTAPKPDEAKPKNAPANIFSASEQGAKQGPPATPTPDPSISFHDVVIAVKKDLGWLHVYTTSFAYAKQFFTRPKLPDKPLDENTPTQKSAARTQAIGSSLKNQDTKTLKVKDKVTTAEQPAAKTVEVTGDAAWMDYAIKDQSKSGDDKVMKIEASHQYDSKWKKQHEIRTDTEKEIRQSNALLLKEKNRPEKTQDKQKISELEKKIVNQKKIHDEADQEMKELEKKYNNQDVIKYLQSTSLDRDLAREDGTSWCGSFVNWCMVKSSYLGATNSQQAKAWLTWGEKIEEPRYGAITVTTRSRNPVEYHVGFYTGIQIKNVPDGSEEITITSKSGEAKVKKRPKFKKISYVRLLSGNMTHSIKEYAGWAVDAKDDETNHLVEYRWPTSKEKK